MPQISKVGIEIAKNVYLHKNGGSMIKQFTKDLIDDVIAFEKQLRVEEDVWGWDIDEEYIKKVHDSFNDSAFDNSLTLLAYLDNKVVGRIDVSFICTHFDGSRRAYLDWICVLKSYRHKGIAQSLMNEMKIKLKELGISSLVGLIAANEEAQRFYRNIPNAMIRDEGIWIDL